MESFNSQTQPESYPKILLYIHYILISSLFSRFRSLTHSFFYSLPLSIQFFVANSLYLTRYPFAKHLLCLVYSLSHILPSSFICSHKLCLSYTHKLSLTLSPSLAFSLSFSLSLIVDASLPLSLSLTYFLIIYLSVFL